MRITVMGLGEAGRRYASDLAALGHQVTAYDPGHVDTPAGVRRAHDVADAACAAELVFALTPSAFSESAAIAAAPYLGPRAVWADFSSAAPHLMEHIGQLLAARKIAFADVAVLGPVPMKGAATELLVSGPAAVHVEQVLTDAGAAVEVLSAPPGAATSLKLLRSVMMKGFAVVTCEAMRAAQAAGQADWMRAQLSGQLAGGAVLVDRFLAGTVSHAGRRAHEMRDVADYLELLGVPSEMSVASAEALERIARVEQELGVHQ